MSRTKSSSKVINFESKDLAIWYDRRSADWSNHASRSAISVGRLTSEQLQSLYLSRVWYRALKYESLFLQEWGIEPPSWYRQSKFAEGGQHWRSTLHALCQLSNLSAVFVVIGIIWNGFIKRWGFARRVPKVWEIVRGAIAQMGLHEGFKEMWSDQVTLFLTRNILFINSGLCAFNTNKLLWGSCLYLYLTCLLPVHSIVLRRSPSTISSNSYLVNVKQEARYKSKSAYQPHIDKPSAPTSKEF